jgi:hypothetical protein
VSAVSQVTGCEGGVYMLRDVFQAAAQTRKAAV